MGWTAAQIRWIPSPLQLSARTRPGHRDSSSTVCCVLQVWSRSEGMRGERGERRGECVCVCVCVCVCACVCVCVWGWWWWMSEGGESVCTGKYSVTYKSKKWKAKTVYHCSKTFTTQIIHTAQSTAFHACTTRLHTQIGCTKKNVSRKTQKDGILCGSRSTSQHLYELLFRWLATLARDMRMDQR